MPSARWHCRGAIAVVSTFKSPTLVHKSQLERSLTIRLGLETPLTQTRDFLQLLEVFLIE